MRISHNFLLAGGRCGGRYQSFSSQCGDTWAQLDGGIIVRSVCSFAPFLGLACG